MKKFLLILGLLAATAVARADVYQAPEEFVAEAFDGDPPQPQLLWVLKPMHEPIRNILGHELNQLRVRYWGQGSRTVWILEEIGKERPITAGFVIDAGRIEQVKVLIYRETRGFEVRYPFFTEQFQGAQLAADHGLDRPIDGITGATLSVSALKRLAALALYLHKQTERGDGQENR